MVRTCEKEERRARAKKNGRCTRTRKEQAWERDREEDRQPCGRTRVIYRGMESIGVNVWHWRK